MKMVRVMEGKHGLRDLAKEARDLGLIMSSKDAASAAVFGDTLDKLRMSLSAVYNKIGAALVFPLPLPNGSTRIAESSLWWHPLWRHLVQSELRPSV